MVTSGLQGRAGVASRAAGSVPWDQAKAASNDRAHAQLVQAIVAEGVRSVLPEALGRGRPLASTDAPDVQAAKHTWALVATWEAEPAAAQRDGGRPGDRHPLRRTRSRTCCQEEAQ